MGQFAHRFAIPSAPFAIKEAFERFKLHAHDFMMEFGDTSVICRH